MTTIGVPLYAARGLSQSLTPAAESKPPPRFTVNGELRHLGVSQMRRYDSVITCKDQDAPPFGGLWTGALILVDCVPELSYLTTTGSPVGEDGWPARREIISGSERVVGLHTYYRIRSEFMVIDWSEGHDEYPHDYQWQLSLRETGRGEGTT